LPLRERKKVATREALRDAALRLAMDVGVQNVRVGEIAEAAGVSPRTFNNYFGSREQAIVSAVVAERDSRLAAMLTALPADARLGDELVDVLVDLYTQASEHDRNTLLLITSDPALQEAYASSVSALEVPIADALATRAAQADALSTTVLARCVAVAVRAALEEWTADAVGEKVSGLLVPSGSLPDLIRRAIAPLRPALDGYQGVDRGRRSSPSKAP
jgi:AcrR family transcriptional regulator